MLAVLCEPRTRWDALWSMWSALRFLANDVTPAMFVDGPIEESWAGAAQRLFPQITIHSVPAWLLANDHPLEAFPEFCVEHPFSRKLALLTALQRENDLVYLDADVLIFSDPVAVRAGLEVRQGRFLIDREFEACDPVVQQRAATLGLTCDLRFNSGLLVLPRKVLNGENLTHLLHGWTRATPSRFTEQTILAVLLSAAGAQPLPPEEYVISNYGMFFWHDDISYTGVVARHFVGNVRHLMYSTGYQLLLHQARAAGVYR
ncbi:MAG: hypothetical protein RIQ93_1263 [Verrucomicrobiota bacterium]|jgi:hypothetical protein